MKSFTESVSALWAALLVTACASGGAGILEVNSTAHIGGEAKFIGDVRYFGDCLQLETSDRRRWTLIFPAKTRSETGRLIGLGFGSVDIPLYGASITGSALRDNGLGWSSVWINRILLGKLSADCEQNVIYVVRIEPSKL